MWIQVIGSGNQLTLPRNHFVLQNVPSEYQNFSYNNYCRYWEYIQGNFHLVNQRFSLYKIAYEKSVKVDWYVN